MHLLRLGITDGDELLGDDGENFNVDAVELVKTAPCS